MAIDFNAYLDRKYDILEQKVGGTPAATSQPLIPGAETANSIRLREEGQSRPATQISGGGLATNTIDSLTNIATRTNFLGQQEDESGKPIRARKGLARVPGKGDGTKDTVKAKLAPGEAVLNKAAADKMGRGLIAALNKMGAQKMGLV